MARRPLRSNARSEREALTGANASRALIELLADPDPESMPIAQDLIEAAGKSFSLRTFTEGAREHEGLVITDETIEYDAKTFAGFIPIFVETSAWEGGPGGASTHLQMFVEWSTYAWKRGQWRTRYTKHTHTLAPVFEPYYEVMVHVDEWFDEGPGPDQPNELVLFKSDWFPGRAHVKDANRHDPRGQVQVYGEDFACGYAIEVAWGIATLLKQLYADGRGTAHQLPLEERHPIQSTTPSSWGTSVPRTYADNAILQLIATANLTIPKAKLVKPSEARLRR